MEDVYCECGQYLTTYFAVLGRATTADSIQMNGIPCPSKDCDKTYTFEKKPTGGRESRCKVSQYLG